MCPLDATFVRMQMASCLDDIGAGCVKTGMLASRDIVEAVADALEGLGPNAPRLVVDPVLVATRRVDDDMWGANCVCLSIYLRVCDLAAFLLPIRRVEGSGLLLVSQTW